jgi:hypothetical protein
MTGRAARWGSVLSGLAFVLVLGLSSLWFAGAIWFHSPRAWRYALVALPIAIAIGLVVLRWVGSASAAWIGLAAALALGALWWNSLAPASVADWAPDVAHGVTAEIGEREVVVRGVRRFDWITETQATERWTTERYDPNTITSLDLASSVWDNPAIAHTLVTFGFADGRHLAFSAEVRRRRGEEFSAFAGFFRTSELVLVAAEEDDILRLRSNVRKEALSLYPLRARPEDMKRLFLTYLETGNDLARQPKFYNTVTANCTTIIFDLARLVGSTLPYSWQVLVSGYLPEYLYREGLIRTTLPWSEVQREALVTPRGQAAPSGASYSAAIRSTGLFRNLK